MKIELVAGVEVCPCCMEKLETKVDLVSHVETQDDQHAMVLRLRRDEKKGDPPLLLHVNLLITPKDVRIAEECPEPKEAVRGSV